MAQTQTVRNFAEGRTKVLKSLHGKTIRIPSLDRFFEHWPTKVNPEVDHARESIREWIDSTLPPSKRREAFQASDFGLISAVFYPCANRERLKILAYFLTWLFVWDDEIDISDGAMWDDFEKAQEFREQTLAYIRYSLEIDKINPDVTDYLILNFEPIGAAIREVYTLEHRMMAYDAISYFMKGSEDEQRIRLSKAIPSVDEYWTYRLGSSAVPACLSLNEFQWNGMHLPIEFYANEHAKAVIKHATTLVTAVNDLLSVKKEIQRDAVDSLVPILFLQTHDIQAAVDKILALIKEEVKKLDRAADTLNAQYSMENATLRQDVANFIIGCKQLTTGNLTWSLQTKRYGVEFAKDGTGDVFIVL